MANVIGTQKQIDILKQQHEADKLHWDATPKILGLERTLSKMRHNVGQCDTKYFAIFTLQFGHASTLKVC